MKVRTPIGRLMIITALIAIAMTAVRDLTFWWTCPYYFLDLGLLCLAFIGAYLGGARFQAICVGFILGTCAYWSVVLMLPESLVYNESALAPFVPPRPPNEQPVYVIVGGSFGLAGALGGFWLAGTGGKVERQRRRAHS
jgi:hypothetical protein